MTADPPRIIAHPEIAPYNMLQQPHRLTLQEGCHHVGEHGTDRVEALVSLADILESEVIEQNLLNNKDGHGFGELRTGFHYSEAERYDLGGEEEVDHVRVVVLLRRVNISPSRKEKRLALTRAPMTPSEVRRRYSNGRVLLVVLRNG